MVNTEGCTERILRTLNNSDAQMCFSCRDIAIKQPTPTLSRVHEGIEKYL